MGDIIRKCLGDHDHEMRKKTMALIRRMHCLLVWSDESLQTINSSGGKDCGLHLNTLIASFFQR